MAGGVTMPEFGGRFCRWPLWGAAGARGQMFRLLAVRPSWHEATSGRQRWVPSIYQARRSGLLTRGRATTRSP